MLSPSRSPPPIGPVSAPDWPELCHALRIAGIQAILAERGDHPGLVHIFSAMEACSSYQPWHNKASGQTLLKPDSGRCLHYYFYFIDEQLGLGYLRVPTWAPFRLQAYFNGHAWLAGQLRAAEIPFTMADNAFLEIGDWQAAQRLPDSLDASPFKVSF